MTAPIGPADLDRAFAWCERVTRERAGNFYHGLKLAPTRKRAALFALYAWMREADDLVDGARVNKKRKKKEKKRKGK